MKKLFINMFCLGMLFSVNSLSAEETPFVNCHNEACRSVAGYEQAGYSVSVLEAIYQGAYNNCMNRQ